MLKFKLIAMKNFLSFGNVPQVVDLQHTPLSIIVGINNDASTDDETRNGVGKSSLIQAMHFALFGKSIDNKIKLANLVNKTNKKNCIVQLTFEKNGIEYQIERSRNPTNLIFKVNGKELENDEAQGENKETQREIENILGMSQDVFSQIITLTTNTEPFLALSTTKQRVIIDELFTITQLTEKAEKLKEAQKQTKDLIANETFRLQTLEQTNEKIHTAIELAIKSSTDYEDKQNRTIEELTKEYNALKDFDIHSEISDFIAGNAIKQKNTEISECERDAVSMYNRFTAWSIEQENAINKCKDELYALDSINIQDELDNHEYNLRIQENINTNKAIDVDILHFTKQKKSIEIIVKEYASKVTSIESELNNTHDEHCPLCGSTIDIEKHREILESTKGNLEKYTNLLKEKEHELQIISNTIKNLELSKVTIDQPKSTTYKDKATAQTHEYTLKLLNDKLQELIKQSNPYDSQLIDITTKLESLGTKEVEIQSKWKSESEIHLAAQYINSLLVKIDDELKRTNPYVAQIEQLKDALQVIDSTELNRYRSLQEHQEFLIKLLTDKNSYVRKMIINQNLAFLNDRLKHYIEKSSSLHVVRFENDLSVNITKFGESYDYDNLSRGEKTRIIISLSLAFRDMFESLNFPTNSLMIDEFLDNGLDAVGVKACYDIINSISQHNKNCFLITHREEIKNKCPTTVTITMEGGFSTVVQESEA